VPPTQLTSAQRLSLILQTQALHDPLTGLPNRVLFGERISQAIRDAQRSGTQLAVALMDLDRFKEVNDSLGHPAGDQLLIEVSRRMGDAVRASDTVARLGGDEFGLLLPRLTRREDAVPVLERIRAAFEWPVYVHSLPLAVEASVGIAVFPGTGPTPRRSSSAPMSPCTTPSVTARRSSSSTSATTSSTSAG
jgi:diguanylate cyclase (GGDEF)-like protein